MAIVHAATHQNLSQPKKPDKTRHHPNQIHPEEHARSDELDLTNHADSQSGLECAAKPWIM
jgi:hypothetical protein